MVKDDFGLFIESAIGKSCGERMGRICDGGCNNCFAFAEYMLQKEIAEGTYRPHLPLPMPAEPGDEYADYWEGRILAAQETYDL